MPFVAASRCAAANAVGEFPTEFLRPVANAFAADVNAVGGEHFPNSQAEREPEIEPIRMADPLGGKAMAAIERITKRVHDPTSPSIRPRSVDLTIRA